MTNEEQVYLLRKEQKELIDKLEGEMAKYREITAQLVLEQCKYNALSSELVATQGKVARLQMELAAAKNGISALPCAQPRFRYVIDPPEKDVYSVSHVPIIVDPLLRDQFPWGAGKYWEQRNEMIGHTLPPGSSVLDLGGGFCQLSQYVTGRYVSLDLQPWTSVTVKADFNREEFPDVGYFDIIVCQGILEYMKDPGAFLRAIRKYGDKLILTYQIGMRPDRFNFLSFEQVQDLLKEAGWDCQAKEPVDSPSQYLFVSVKRPAGIPAYWWGENKRRNWGDVFTEFLFKNWYSMPLELTSPEAAEIFGCGSILEHIPNGYAGAVLGAGAQHADTRRDLSKVKGPILVRGQYTYDRCTFGDQTVYQGDPGILAYLFVDALKPRTKSIGLIPHYVDKDCAAVKEFGARGGYVIDVEAGVGPVIDAVASCQSIISSSLHGLVLADSLGIPNRWVKLSDNVGGAGFKFRDYYSVYGEDVVPALNIQDAANTCKKRDTSAVKSAVHSAFDSYVKQKLRK